MRISMQKIKKSIMAGILLSVMITSPVFSIGQSAVITLVFPPGARSTGLGEAFTGLADDASATYYNPAGLGQAPLANAWKTYTIAEHPAFTSIASKKKKDFSLKERIWVGTPKGIVQYDGNAWITYEKYLILQDDTPEKIIRKFLAVTDEEIIAKAVLKLKEANGIEGKRTRALSEYLHKEIPDSLLKQKKYSIDRLIADILDIPTADRSAPKIYGIIADKADTSKSSKMADSITEMLKMSDVSFEDLVDLKIPFSIAVNDSITALSVDSLDRLWVGTQNGLWRFDGSVWNFFSVADGLPSNSITTITAGSQGTVAAGTDQGAVLYSDAKFTLLSGDTEQKKINAVAFGKNGTIYIGTSDGVSLKKDSAWTKLDTSAGLLNNQVNALMFDSHGKLWIGGVNGISIYDEISWKRYKFPGSTVHAILEYNSNTVWIGTDKGAISYTHGSMVTDKSGKKMEEVPEWKAYHSKNGLKGNNVQAIAVHGNDIWLVTDIAVNQYDYAEKQILTFWEPLLPAFNLPELWHVYFSLVWPTTEWGTIGLLVNYINFGTNEWTNDLGAVVGKARSWEGVFGLSYGLSLMQDFSVGLNVKYAHSALAPGYGSGDEGIGRTFAVDAAMLKRNFLVNKLDVGLNFQNMGPSIFYISEQEKDPIPFTIKLGTAYHAIKTPVHTLNLVLDLNREIVKTYSNKDPDPFWKAIWTDLLNDTSALTDTTKSRFFNEIEEINLNAGIEYWYANFLALRLGHLFDYIGKRFELTFGLGLKYGNMNFDWSYIYSPEGFMKGIVAEGSNGSRNGQYRLSMLFKI
jgi:hypothetical protein